MAEQRRSGRGKGVPHHPLVEALASDPNQPPGRATRLFGLPGPAADANSTRLWLDSDLTSYVDVPNDAILHSHTLENDQGTTLWVDPAAKLTYSRTQSHEVQADFLSGSIAQGNLGAAMPPSGAVFPAAFERGGWPASVGQGCLKPATDSPQMCHTWIDCETPIVRCQPVASVDVWCPPVASVDVACPPSSVGPVCQLSIDLPCRSTPRGGCPPVNVGHTTPGAWCDPQVNVMAPASQVGHCQTTPLVGCTRLIPTMICFSAALPCVTAANCP
jgi:hypothetical protein